MLKQRKIGDFFGSGKAMLFLLITLYLTLQLLNVKLPGLYADEVLPACGSLQIIKMTKALLPGIKIFNINFPVMLRCEYETALESYILLPFFWLFGVSAVTLRLVPIITGAVMLLFMYSFLKEFFDRETALLSLFLLVISSVFLIETKLGLNSASMLHFTAMAALWSLFRWYKGKPDRYFYLGIFLLGVGISIRVWFVWFVNGMIFLAVIFNRQLRERMKNKISKYIIWSVIIFLAGNILFVFYNFRSGFNTLRYIFEHFSQTHALANNFHYLHNLHARLKIFTLYLEGIWSLLDQGSWGNRTPLGEISSNFLAPFLFLGAVIWLAFSPLFNKTGFSKRRIQFILVLFLSILFQAPFTLSSLGGPHLFILYPLVQIILGIALIDILRKSAGNRKLLIVISSIIFVFLFFEINTTVRNNYLYFDRTGGTGNNSDSIYDLAKYLEDHGIHKPVVMDWGICNNLIFLSRGKIIPGTPVNLGEDMERKILMEKFRTVLKSDNGGIYIFHSPEFSNRKEMYPLFKKAAEESGKEIRIEKIFCQRDGSPVYVLYSLS